MRKYLSKDYRRAHGVIITIALVALLAVIKPTMLPVVLTKVAEACVAGVAGFWLDRLVFPYGRPYDFQERMQRHTHDSEERAIQQQGFNTATLRRALIIAATVIGVCLGL